jgi:hypothetical protein
MTASKPSESEWGRRWLSNFAPDDVATASSLIDAIRFLSEDEFRAGLTRLATEVIQDLASEGPIALYPVEPPPVATQPGIPLLHVEPRVSPAILPGAGSEFIVANVITELVKTFKASVEIRASPDQSELLSMKCRNVIIMDDYAGSGGTVIDYLDGWLRNKTVRSWRSYRKIRFHLLTYAWSSRAALALHRHPLIGRIVRAVEVGLDFDSAPWSTEERGRIIKLCKDYAKNAKMALGYGDSRGLLVMNHTAPNNVPHILFKGKRSDGGAWLPFFPAGHRRLSPDQQMSLGGYRPSGRYSVLAAGTAQNAIAASRQAWYFPSTPLDRGLMAIRDGVRNREHLGRYLALNSFEVRAFLRTATSLKLIDEKFHLTDRGWAELRFSRTRRRAPRSGLHGSDAPYYPVTLRGVSEV